jgi:hypothetical protein
MIQQRALLCLLTLGVFPSLGRASLPPVITAAPDLFRRQVSDALVPQCSGYSSIANSCAARIPGFSSLPLQSQVSCACSISSTWAGSIFNSYFDECLDYLETASSADFSRFTSLTGVFRRPCDALGPSVSNDFVNCQTQSSIQASCSVASSNFSTLAFSDQASCLCYTGSSFAPSIFDGAWKGCLAYYSTVSSAVYSSMSLNQVGTTPCASAGNVRGAPTIAATPTPSSSTHPLTTTEALATGPNVNGAAFWMRCRLARVVVVTLTLGWALG